MLSLGQTIRDARLERGMSQGDLEKKGFKRHWISKVENDRNEPMIRTLIELGNAIGIPAWEILKRFQQQQ